MTQPSFSNLWRTCCLCTHSDDLLSVGPDNSRLNLQQHLSSRLRDIKIKGDIVEATCLGMVISRNRKTGCIRITQPALLKDIVDGVVSEAHSTPYAPNFSSISDQQQASEEDFKWFRSTLMKINFLTRSRPELKFFVSYLASRMHSPTFNDVDSLRWGVGYRKGSPGLGLNISPTSLQISASVDASFAQFKEDAKSQAGIAIFLGDDNAPIAVTSSKLHQVIPDSTGAELGALSMATKDLLWWMYMLESIGFDGGCIC